MKLLRTLLTAGTFAAATIAAWGAGSMGKVYVNGKYVGGVWTTPYKVDITDFVTDGDNEIRVEVANTWVNRIVGDLNLPEEERDVYLFINPHPADSPLPPSGLIGKANVVCF